MASRALAPIDMLVGTWKGFSLARAQYERLNSILEQMPEEGEHMATADYRDIVLIAGSDPYSWKGIVDRAKPSVRPSGEGGCSKTGK